MQFKVPVLPFAFCTVWVQLHNSSTFLWSIATSGLFKNEICLPLGLDRDKGQNSGSIWSQWAVCHLIQLVYYFSDLKGIPKSLYPCILPLLAGKSGGMYLLLTMSGWQLECFYFECSREAHKHSHKTTDQKCKHWFINKVYLLVGVQKLILKIRNYKAGTWENIHFHIV